MDETVHLIKGIGGVAYGYKCDLANRENVYTIAKKTQEDVGDVSILHEFFKNEIKWIFHINLHTAWLSKNLMKTIGNICILSKFRVRVSNGEMTYQIPANCYFR